MNASALLQSQGWRGEGHTLHATNDKIGLKNRLLVGHKKNTQGLGASAAANDQWWLSALDEQLGGITTKNGKIVNMNMVTDGKLDRLKDTAGQSELYKFFVRGEPLQGTVDKLMTEQKDEVAGRKADAKARMRKLRGLPAIAKKPEESTPRSGERKETKEERRARKLARSQRREQKAARREQKRARKEARKLKSRSASSTDADEGTDGAKAARSETKEERRARRETRRKRKEDRRRSKR